MRQFFKQIPVVLQKLEQKIKMVFAKQYKTVFADDERIVTQEMIDVVLSPKYYWVKIEELGVKYAFQAKEYAPALFEGSVTAGDYSYKAIKNENRFSIFAYDAKEIVKNLGKLGLKTHQIHNVYFAQTEFLGANLKINDNFALATKNGKVIKVPLELAQNTGSLSRALQNLNVSKNSIKLGKFERLYEGNFRGIIFALSTLAVLFLAEFFYVKSLIGKEESIKAEIMQNYSLPSTELQLNALSKQYDKINKEQRNIREAVKKLFYYGQFGEKVKSLDVSLGSVTFVAEELNKDEADTLKSYFGKEFKLDEFSQNGAGVNVKASYE